MTIVMMATSSATDLPEPVRGATWLFLLLTIVLGGLFLLLLLASIRRWRRPGKPGEAAAEESVATDPWSEAGQRLKPYNRRDRGLGDIEEKDT